MNLNRRRNKSGDSDDGMSSMTDLVFLMLIFFIIMSTMAKSTLPVDLPTGKGSGSQSDPVVEVAVNASDEYFIDANETAYYTIEEVIPILEAKIAEQSTPGLKISGDKKASYEAIFNLIAVAKQKDWKPVLSYKN